MLERVIQLLIHRASIRMTSPCSITSAPGKVLLTGGYLVLDPAYSGCVVATTARFTCQVTSGLREENPGPEEERDAKRGSPEAPQALDMPQGLGPPISTPLHSVRIDITSPQFTDGAWSYHWSWMSSEEGPAVQLHPCSGSGENPFVAACLLFVLRYAVEKLGHTACAAQLSGGLRVAIRGDNDFYSQQAYGIPKWNATKSTISKVHKTGLGSSAAMLTSLTASLLLHFGLVAPEPELPAGRLDQASRTLVHALAQLSHCFAQGKIGSGFDVSAAVHGSHVYTRFSPTLLQPLLAETASPAPEALLALTKRPWDCRVTPFSLPPGFTLALAEISTGSNTPRLVSSVLQWRRQQPEAADALYARLCRANDGVVEALRDLAQSATRDAAEYAECLERCCASPMVEVQLPGTKPGRLLTTLHAEFQEVRAALRALSACASVPIEPPSQSRLLDACMTIPGVVMAGVPGAGGFDAIFCVHVGGPECQAALEHLWLGWSEMSVSPLLAREGQEGVRIEPPLSF